VANNLRSYDQLVPYLTETAQNGIEKLKQLGIEDRDLAMTLLEKFLPEEDIYELPTE